MEDISFEVESTTLVWCRTSKTEKRLPSRMIARSVALGLVDLLGEGSLPIDRTLRPGQATLGDGFGFAWVRSKFSPDRPTRMTLLAAQHVVRNGMADYATPDGSEPIEEPRITPSTSKRRAVAH